VAVDPGELLRQVHRVLVIDWPSREVPVTLARARYEVIVRGGPGPSDYAAYEAGDDAGGGPGGDGIIVRPAGRAPEQADLVYCHRPVSELAGIAAQARSLGARAIWRQSGRSSEFVSAPGGCWVPPQESREARATIEAAGLAYIEEPYIVDVVRSLAVGSPEP
jgi:hypothetical protein